VVATVRPGEPAPGKIVFGTGLATGGLSVEHPRTTFKRTTKRIAWAAWLTDAWTSGSDELTVWRKTADGEIVVWRTAITVDAAHPDRQGQSLDLASAVDHVAGTYVVRYLVTSLPAAEGTFKLVD
jgi:hypothetical protein